MTLHCTIKVSKDGGKNWGAATIHDLGETGEFGERGKAHRRRLGSSRSFMLEASVSDPYKADVLALAIQAQREE